MIEVNCAAQQLSENIKVAFAEMSSQYLKHYASKVSRTLRFSVANLTWNVIKDIRFERIRNWIWDCLTLI